MLRIALLFLAAVPLFSGDWYMFTSFRDNGESGVFLALSQDGEQWRSTNKDKPWVKSEIAGMLMRDPWIGQGPDGVWHMLWTCGWTRASEGEPLKIGHTSSKDLVTWTPQTEISVMEKEPLARNAWAPEAVWDDAKQEWLIFFASTIPGRFPDIEGTGDSGYNHRIYSLTTKDWHAFSPTKLLFDPGFNSIDSTMVHDGDRWIMVFKDERKTPLKKQLRLAFAASPSGPWNNVSEPFTVAWAEGPTALHIGAEWWIYFDHYAKPQHYGAMRTRDWKNFEDMTAEVSFPPGQRHGTAVRITDDLAHKLLTGPLP